MAAAGEHRGRGTGAIGDGDLVGGHARAWHDASAGDLPADADVGARGQPPEMQTVSSSAKRPCKRSSSISSTVAVSRLAMSRNPMWPMLILSR